MGSARFPLADRLLIKADAGGSNGYRLRAWKLHLARLAEELGLEVTVCHYPPGTSKWNKIEHRMFSFITMNCRGRPLVSYRGRVGTYDDAAKPHVLLAALPLRDLLGRVRGGSEAVRASA